MTKKVVGWTNLQLTRQKGVVEYPYYAAWVYRSIPIKLDERDGRYYHNLAGVTNGLLSLEVAMVAVDGYLNRLDVKKAEERGYKVLLLYPYDQDQWRCVWIYRGLSVRHSRRTGLFVSVLGLFPSLGQAFTAINIYHSNHGRGYVSRETFSTHD